MAMVRTTCRECGRPIEVEIPSMTEVQAQDPDQEKIFAICGDCGQIQNVRDGGRISHLTGEPEGALFKIGGVMTTPQAAELLARAEKNGSEFVLRHARGDWGRHGSFAATNVTQKEIEGRHRATDKVSKLNKISAMTGIGTVHSSYTVAGEELWVYTDMDGVGASTTVMTPDDY